MKGYIKFKSGGIVKDRQTGKHYDCFHKGSHPGELYHEKNKLNLRYYDSVMSGLYPNYTAYIHDDINDIILDIEFNANTPPHFYGTEPTESDHLSPSQSI